MKKTLVFFFVAVCMICLPVMGQVEKRQLYEEKIQSFTNMRNGGIAMAAVGSGLTIAGTVLLVSIPDYYWDGYYDYYGDDYEDYSFRAVGGIIMLGVGIGLMAGGITMASIGGHKISQYQQRLKNLSLGIICTPKRQGLTLTYRF
jgi:hypothetical protein